MVLGAIISGAIGIAGGMASDAAANAAMERQYEYDKKVWRYNWRESKRDYRHQKQGVNIARSNEAAERGWRDTTALNDYNHGMAIRDYEYKNQMRAYNKSEETYKQQLSFNNMAAQVAMESEDRFLDEKFKETAFQNQDILVQMLQEEGQAGLLQPGKSAAKAVHSVLAQAGRNQAILVESMVSAQKQHSVNIKKIRTDKYGADIQAEANRMLKPEISPALPKPIPLPTTIFQDPKKPRKPPKPIKGATSNAGLISGAVGAAQGIVGAIKW